MSDSAPTDPLERIRYFAATLGAAATSRGTNSYCLARLHDVLTLLLPHRRLQRR